MEKPENSRGGGRVRQTRRARAEFEKFERPGVRWLTSVTILALCSFSILRGWEIVRFVDARAHFRAHEAGAEEIRSWDQVPGLRDTALQASLTGIADISDVDGARRRAADLSVLLSVRPLSSINWLSLSGMWLAAGQNEKEVVSALRMSWLTGPNEGSIMLHRGTFGVMLWEVLSPDARGRVIADLAGAILGTPIDDNDLKAAKNLLATKSVDIRKELTTRLGAESVPAAQLLRLGL